jgi:hypothetical protein
MAPAWSASSPQRAGSGCRCWNRHGRRRAPRVRPTSPAHRRRLAAPRQLRRARTEAPRLRRQPPAHDSFVRRAWGQPGADRATGGWGPSSISGTAATHPSVAHATEAI